MSMAKFALGIQYDGSAYCGWQLQRNSPSVQAVVEEALSIVADENVRVNCAGRTDSGVHALGQVVHFESSKPRPERAWRLGTNANLPLDVSVQWVHEVSENFHARFSALSRQYTYIILNHPSRPALWARKVSWQPVPLNAEVMHEAAQNWLGENDFSAFRAAGCQSNSPNRFVDYFTVSRHGDYVIISVRANAFLHHMVRNFVGVLLEIGRGKREPNWAAEVLASRRRANAAETAPPDGLYLTEVRYPAEFGLPQTIADFPFDWACTT